MADINLLLNFNVPGNVVAKAPADIAIKIRKKFNWELVGQGINKKTIKINSKNNVPAIMLYHFVVTDLIHKVI